MRPRNASRNFPASITPASSPPGNSHNHAGNRSICESNSTSVAAMASRASPLPSSVKLTNQSVQGASITRYTPNKMTGSGGKKSRQQPGQRRYDDEVDHEQRGEEASVSDHAAQFQQRHLHEGDVKQGGQHGSKQLFQQWRDGGRAPTENRAQRNRDQIEKNLAAFQLQARQHAAQCGETRLTQPAAIAILTRLCRRFRTVSIHLEAISSGRIFNRHCGRL